MSDAGDIQEINRLERLILFFAKQKRLVRNFPEDHGKSAQLDSMVERAETHLYSGQYGKAISAYKNAMLYFRTWELEVPDRLTCNSFHATMECQISMALLLLGNCRDALNHANKCIIHEPSMQLIHLWRAIAFRGLGYYARAVKSLSVRVPFFLGCCLRCSWGDIYRFVAVPLWNLYEEDVVATYWTAVYNMVSSKTRLYKVDHFVEDTYLSDEESDSVLSLRFLHQNPAYHYSVIVDHATMRVLPDTHHAVLNEAKLRFFHQVTGFTEKTPGLTYFNSVPKSSKYLIQRLGRASCLKVRRQVVEKLRYLAEVSDTINCTSYEMRLLAGFGVYERLLLCSALVLNKDFEEAVHEYKCLKADISLFALLGRKADLRYHCTMMKHLNAVRKILYSLKARVKLEYQNMRSVGHITQWLQKSSILWLQEKLPTSRADNEATKNKKTSKYERHSGEWRLAKASPEKIRLQRRESA